MKFPLFNKKVTRDIARSFSFLGTDFHSHLVPGIDDGSPDVETSIALITSLKELGYTKLITTPHVMQGQYPNDRSTIVPGRDLLRRELAARGIGMELHAAAEYFLDPGLIEAIQDDEPLLTVSGKKLLVEISFAAPPMQLHEFLYHLQLKGYEPILAHPERYKYYHNDMDQYKKLMDVGCELQLNLLSVIGYYGKDVRKAALKLLDRQWLTYLATDLHHGRHLEGLRTLASDEGLMGKLQAYQWKNQLL